MVKVTSTAALQPTSPSRLTRSTPQSASSKLPLAGRALGGAGRALSQPLSFCGRSPSHGGSHPVSAAIFLPLMLSQLSMPAGALPPGANSVAPAQWAGGWGLVWAPGEQQQAGI